LLYIYANYFIEELLIDFRELIGQHSGENMAAVVWSTLELYEIQSKVCIVVTKPLFACIKSSKFFQIMAVMMDNASNNDTMMQAIERRCHEAGIQFCAKDSRMRCMPHTIHLSAIKVRSHYSSYYK